MFKQNGKKIEKWYTDFFRRSASEEVRVAQIAQNHICSSPRIFVDEVLRLE